MTCHPVGGVVELPPTGWLLLTTGLDDALYPPVTANGWPAGQLIVPPFVAVIVTTIVLEAADGP
jgi:hypothetical protein